MPRSVKPTYYDRRNRFFILVGSILALGIALAIAAFVPPHFQLDQPTQGNLTPYSGAEFHGPIPTPTSTQLPQAGPLPTEVPRPTPSIDQTVSTSGSTVTISIHFPSAIPRTIHWVIYTESGSAAYRAQWVSQSSNISATFQTGLARGTYTMTTEVNGEIVRTNALFSVT